MDVGVHAIITDSRLPDDGRVIIRQYPPGLVQVFVHRPSLLADPEGVVRELLNLSDTDLRTDGCRWQVA